VDVSGETVDGTRCGYAAIVGAPNAGKSTLLNQLVGSKVSIVTPKVQTTRSRVLGIRIAGATQVVFVDTPGIFAAKRRLDRAMVDAAWQGAAEADAIVLVVDAGKGFRGDTARIVAGLKDAGRRAILAINKVDAVKRPALLSLAQQGAEHGIFDATFMISALTGDGVDDLLAHVAAAMPAGPWLFPEDDISDVPLRSLAAEITREQAFLQLHDELPYSLAVETESWEEFDNGDVRIHQTLYVQRDSQKAIALGRGGQKVRAIGGAARAELEAMLERKVHLFLHVKVREDWIEDPERFRQYGLEYKR
jgi:GTP-binding protein Era